MLDTGSDMAYEKPLGPQRRTAARSGVDAAASIVSPLLTPIVMTLAIFT
jgi:hypothetical protein